VASENFRGFCVKPIDLEEVWENFGVREALEVYAVKQAIQVGSADDLRLMEERLNKHKEYMPGQYTRKKFLLDSEFHLQIADMARNSVLRYLLKRNLEHIYLRARLDDYDPERMVSSSREHEELLERMKRKDIIGSIEIIQNHIQTARDHVISCLSEQKSDEREYGYS
jgi:DNA-binding GntR family transcriptional regulator